MTTKSRLLALAVVAFSALTFAGSALARAELTVLTPASRLVAANEIEFSLTQAQTDPAPLKITISVPPGYSSTLARPAGQTIGTASAEVFLKVLGNTRATASGPVVTDDPARYTTNPCAPGLHQAVWVLNLTLQGQAIQIPIYVDAVTTPTSSATIQLCLRSPDVPQTSGGAALGAQLLDATFSVRGVFARARGTGRDLFNAVITPYRPGTASPNPAGTMEARSIVSVPSRATLRATIRCSKRLRRGQRCPVANQRVLLAGTYFEAGRAVSGVMVLLVRGPRTGRVQAVGQVRTGRGGRYALIGPRPRVVTFFTILIPVRDMTVTGCQGATAPGGCSATAAPAASNTVRVTPAPRRR